MTFTCTRCERELFGRDGGGVEWCNECQAGIDPIPSCHFGHPIEPGPWRIPVWSHADMEALLCSSERIERAARNWSRAWKRLARKLRTLTHRSSDMGSDS